MKNPVGRAEVYRRQPAWMLRDAYPILRFNAFMNDLSFLRASAIRESKHTKSPSAKQWSFQNRLPVFFD